MGKIRVKTLGNEDEEQQKKEAKARAEAKRIQALKEQGEKAAAKKAEQTEETKPEPAQTAEPEKKEEKKMVHKPKGETGKANIKHSKTFLALAANVDKNKKYSLDEALELLPKLKRAKFDETVELHVNTATTGVSGSVVLPHGNGKKMRVEIANQSDDPKHVEELVKTIEAGQINFDILIATPDSMPKLARVARVLGPRGLMPNPKNGTVSPKPSEVAKKFEAGQLNFKSEAKFPLLHMSVGKASFGKKELAENIKAAIEAVQTKNIKEATVKSTMSPGIKLDIATL